VADTGRPPRYVAEDGTGYAEVTQVFAGPGGRLAERPVIRHNGHCLIASIYDLHTRDLIPPERVAAYRERAHGTRIALPVVARDSRSR